MLTLTLECSDSCSFAFLSYKHWFGAGSLVLILKSFFTFSKHLRGTCCGLTVIVITLSHKLSLTTVNQSDCLMQRSFWQNHQTKPSLEFVPFPEEAFLLLPK